MVAATGGVAPQPVMADRTAVFLHLRRSLGASRSGAPHSAIPMGDESASFLAPQDAGAADVRRRRASLCADAWRLWMDAYAGLDARFAAVEAAVARLAEEHERETSADVDWGAVARAPFVEVDAGSRVDALVRRVTRAVGECRAVIRELTEGALAAAVLEDGGRGTGAQALFMLSVRTGLLGRLGRATSGLAAVRAASLAAAPRAGGASLIGTHGVSAAAHGGVVSVVRMSDGGPNPFCASEGAGEGGAQQQLMAAPAPTADSAFFAQRERELAHMEASAAHIASLVAELRARAEHQGTALDSVEFSVGVAREHVVRAHAALVRRQRAQDAAQGRRVLLLAVSAMLVVVLFAIALRMHR